MTSIISPNAIEYGSFFIQSTPYGYTVAEKYYNRHGDLEPYYHRHRHNNERKYFSTIRSAMEYCSEQED